MLVATKVVVEVVVERSCLLDWIALFMVLGKRTISKGEETTSSTQHPSSMLAYEGL
jgi:hypothetical protein